MAAAGDGEGGEREVKALWERLGANGSPEQKQRRQESWMRLFGCHKI